MQKVVVTQLLFIAKDKHGESSLLFGVDKLYMDVSFSMFAVTEAASGSGAHLMSGLAKRSTRAITKP